MIVENLIAYSNKGGDDVHFGYLPHKSDHIGTHVFAHFSELLFFCLSSVRARAHAHLYSSSMRFGLTNLSDNRERKGMQWAREKMQVRGVGGRSEREKRKDV